MKLSPLPNLFTVMRVWKDRSIGKVSALQPRKPELKLQNPHKSKKWRHMLAISAPRRQKQGDPWDLLTSWNTLCTPVKVVNDTCALMSEADLWPLHSQAHMYTGTGAHTCAHTNMHMH